MGFPASFPLSASRFLIALSKEQFCRLHGSFLINVHEQRVSVTCSTKLPRMQMQHFSDSTKFIVFLNSTKDKLWELVPDSVKQFPWKKAEKVALHELWAVGKEALKWSLLAYFAISFPFGILYSFSGNKELLIPLGLFVGCLISNFLNEIYQEFISDHKDGGVDWKLLGISCFFILVKFISGGNDLFLHIANGGLMQALWNWKTLRQLDSENSSPDDASTAVNSDC